MLKKLSTVLLALMLVAGLAFMGCGNGTTNNGDDNVATWQDVLDDFMADAGTSLAATPNGIVVTNRTDGWNGIEMNINAIRGLVAGNAPIVITGT